MVSRRRFVSAAAATLVVASVPAAFVPTAKAAGKYSAAWWRRRVGAQAEFQGEHWHLGELLDVRENFSSRKAEQFTLVFQGSANDQIAEAIYKVRIARRRVKLFVQPSGGDGESNYYVASVSRLKRRRRRRRRR